MDVRAPWFVAGFLVGSAVGAAVALLWAPARGAETLTAIRAHFAKAQLEAHEAGVRAEAEILSRYKQGVSASAPLAPNTPSPASTV